MRDPLTVTGPVKLRVGREQFEPWNPTVASPAKTASDGTSHVGLLFTATQSTLAASVMRISLAVSSESVHTPTHKRFQSEHLSITLLLQRQCGWATYCPQISKKVRSL